MAISIQLAYAKTDELNLDPRNPRLGNENIERNLSQEQLFKMMSKWDLEELAVSFLEGGGFWTHEALLVTRENLYGKSALVVIEGNRRVATLKCLLLSASGAPPPRPNGQRLLKD